MKRLGWGILAFILSLVMNVPASAIDTVPTTPNKVTGPFAITGYSFSGPNLRYVQIYNTSSSLALLDNWQITSTTKTTPAATINYATLSGFLEPGKHVIAAVPGLIESPAFSLPAYQHVASPLVGTVSLVAPLTSSFNDEVVSVPAISSTTIKEVDAALINYYLKRDVSTTTGNYVTGFSFMLPTEKIKNDQVYVVPQNPMLQIAELYPDPKNCSPFDSSALCSDYVKLFNASDGLIDLSLYRLRTGTHGQPASSSNTKSMNGVIAPGQYVIFPMSLSSSGSWVWLEDAYGSARFEQSVVEYPSNSGHSNEAWSYDDVGGLWRWTNLPTPSNVPNMFPVSPKVNTCQGLLLSEIAANVATEDQFIELHNPTSNNVDMSGCVLQTNRSTSAVFKLPDALVAPESYITVYVKDTPLTLTKTTSGTVYVLSSDLLSEVDVVSYSDLKEATSWARIDTTWLQTYDISPNAQNRSLKYPLCAEGYDRNLETGNCNKAESLESELSDCGAGKYRSPDTNRCRSLEALAVALTPCDVGQYRSPDTNRCRTLASTASILVPCAQNQERNLETNRCRNIASSNELKPCAANQERNPDTNRCRNKTSSISTDFPVEAVAQSGEATLGWWAFGGVGTLAAGYAGWEWRREVLAWIRKVLPFGTGRS